MAKQGTLRQGKISHIDGGQGNPGGEKEYQELPNGQRQAHFH